MRAAERARCRTQLPAARPPDACPAARGAPGVHQPARWRTHAQGLYKIVSAARAKRRCPSGSARTRCAMPARRTGSLAAASCARCRRCSGTPTSPRRGVTPSCPLRRDRVRQPGLGSLTCHRRTQADRSARGEPSASLPRFIHRGALMRLGAPESWSSQPSTNSPSVSSQRAASGLRSASEKPSGAGYANAKRRIWATRHKVSAWRVGRRPASVSLFASSSSPHH